MKTKIRIQHTEGNALGAKYKHMYIQILAERYKGARYLQPMGEITFQANTDEPDRWYGMTFKLETDNDEYIERMAKIAKFIKKNRSDYNAQPSEILLLIGAQEHIHFDGEFIPVSDKGKNIYRVIQSGHLYDKITAPNEIIAQKILDKKKIVGAELKFDKQINF
jgi:hypothetical protein